MASKVPLNQRPTFTLEGHSIIGDKRTTPIRGDLADIKLAGKLFAPHYAVPLLRSCVESSVVMHEEADGDSTPISELLMGEDFALLDVSGKWAWGYSLHDDYLGYVQLSTLGDQVKTTHVVDGPGALVFSAPKVRAPVNKRLPMGARLVCGELSECGRFLATEGGFVHIRHVSAIGEVEGSHADLAEKLLGTPYGWGARSGNAIDCSGLVQMTLGLKGIACPRDSDLQEAAIGDALDDKAKLQRGDLVFFPGHVGIMADGENIIHANTHWMKVVNEPLADVAARFADEPGGPITVRKRIG